MLTEKKTFSNDLSGTLSECQTEPIIAPGLHPYSLQRLSADDTSCISKERVKRLAIFLHDDVIN